MKRKIWDWYAPIYSRAMRAEERSYSFLYRRIPKLVCGKEVLEIATGPGLLAKRIAPVTKRMLATDYSAGMIAEAKKGACPRNLRFEVADALSLPYADASFDHCECPTPFAGAGARSAGNSPRLASKRYFDCPEFREETRALCRSLLGSCSVASRCAVRASVDGGGISCVFQRSWLGAAVL